MIGFLDYLKNLGRGKVISPILSGLKKKEVIGRFSTELQTIKDAFVGTRIGSFWEFFLVVV